MQSPPRPLIVRLRNWVGDVTLGLPALQRLADAGFDLQLVGKPWARDLLAGHAWPVHSLAATRGERVSQLRELALQARAVDGGFGKRINAVAFPFSFSSALEMRLAGLRAIGHAAEARGWLLSRSVKRPVARHELEVYWQLASALLGRDEPLPERIGLRTTAQDQAQAQALLDAHGIARGFIVICPFAGGTWEKRDKTWPEFAAFAAQDLRALNRPVVVCPGPGEEAVAREHFAGATLLPDVRLGTYAALLARAALMISNDTGPGHMAAAVGTPLVSVLGPTDALQWRAWGPKVHLVQGKPLWPSRQQVADAVHVALLAVRR